MCILHVNMYTKFEYILNAKMKYIRTWGLFDNMYVHSTYVCVHMQYIICKHVLIELLLTDEFSLIAVVRGRSGQVRV